MRRAFPRKRSHSVAAIVREAVDGLLVDQDRRDDQFVGRLSAAGTGHSRLGDLAVHHDAYLAERGRSTKRR